jgi:MFS family permease
MLKKTTLFLGISILWLPLGMLFDGFNSLILPAYALNLAPNIPGATMLGLVSFLGIMTGMIAQLIAASYSDKLRGRWGRKGMIGLGMLLLLPLLLLAALFSNFFLVAIAYLLIQVIANIVQAALQAFIPEQVEAKERGMASGLKNLMDIGGALLVFMLLAELFNEGKAYLVFPAIAGAFLLAYLLTQIFVHEPQQAETRHVEHINYRPAFSINLQEHRAFVWLIISRFFFLLATYGVGRFLLLFVDERLGLEANSAGEETANILVVLTFVTVLAAPAAGWLCDRINRRLMMIFGALISALGVIMLIMADSSAQILIFGSLMAFGSAAFSTANWSLSADLAPRDEAARYLAFANIGTACAAAFAGVLGLLIDFGNQFGSGTGYSLCFFLAALIFLASCFAVYRMEAHEAVKPAAAQIQE